MITRFIYLVRHTRNIGAERSSYLSTGYKLVIPESKYGRRDSVSVSSKQRDLIKRIIKLKKTEKTKQAKKKIRKNRDNPPNIPPHNSQTWCLLTPKQSYNPSHPYLYPYPILICEPRSKSFQPPPLQRFSCLYYPSSLPNVPQNLGHRCFTQIVNRWTPIWGIDTMGDDWLLWGGEGGGF